MPKKIRVYELARELGLTNKEALDLCIGLGIGVKSHSSSIEDQQADRVRRKADREGLRREVQPEEEEPVAKKAGKARAAADKAEPATAEAGPLGRPDSPRLVSSRPTPAEGAALDAPTPAVPAAPAPAAPVAPAAQAPPAAQ
ncbi:MAG: translation initiation factor IF-2 N-terminal domain-containing protein, partial [Actinomycetota bacterium]|nr:translation initiation factor IF-2 N-terminal domain-containing protein [Actinomycetota bacterium]